MFRASNELAQIYQWSQGQPLTVNQALGNRVRIALPTATSKEWVLFESVLSLPQYLFSGGAWLPGSLDLSQLCPHSQLGPPAKVGDSSFTRDSVPSRVSYALVATVAEPWMSERSCCPIFLAPLSDHELKPWITNSMATAGLDFDREDQSLALFLDYAQGHINDAIALAQRIWFECHVVHRDDKPGVIQSYHVHGAMLSLVQDLSVTFEALLLLLPPTRPNYWKA